MSNSEMAAELEALRARVAGDEAERKAVRRDMGEFGHDLTGHIWSIIRGQLSGQLEALKQAQAAEQYEVESAILDGIAREMAAAVFARIAPLMQSARSGAICEAVTEEREACAKVADNLFLSGDEYYWREYIAAAIRARGEP